MGETYIWIRDCYVWDTNCGHSYNPFVVSEQQPKINHHQDGDICPYCGCTIEYIDEEEEDEDCDE